jgi:nucleotide-binding universal stress UspA family protein
MKRFLVPLLGNESDKKSLKMAQQLVGQAGRIDAVLFQRDPRDMMPIAGEGFSAGLAEQIIEASEAGAQSQLEDARRIFDEWASEAKAEVTAMAPLDSLSASFDQAIGNFPGTFVDAARSADAIVLCRGKEAEGPDRATLVEAALMGSGRPVYLAADRECESVGKRVMIGWNGSQEAARAVAASTGLTGSAEMVTITTIEDGGVSADASGLIASLRMTGKLVEVASPKMESEGVAATLLKEARSCQSDLLVLGAYSHSRIREMVFGGVTDDILEGADIPVLLVG